MGGRQRCSECRRIIVPITEPGAIPGIDALKPHMGTLLLLAREFDAETPAGESYTAVDFLDSVALSIADEDKYAKPAGNPGQVGSKRKAA